MENRLLPNMRPALIGSLPLHDHGEATRLVLEQVPEIPLWVQLPRFKQEGMMAQFLPGFPGFREVEGKLYIDNQDPGFEDAVLAFYEDYLAVGENPEMLADSRFALDRRTAAGFFAFLEQARPRAETMYAVKGQITGPFTFATGVVDAAGRALFYDEQLRDIAVKQIATKARWQARALAELEKPVMVFFDEPGLTAFGSSAFISISREEVMACFEEVFEAVHTEGALAGVHVCANAEWSIILESTADIVSFDAYSFFDKFILYPEAITEFINQGKILAWGIVPTSSAADIEKETLDSLVDLWERERKAVEDLGVDREVLQKQSLITPSCGTGSLEEEAARRVLELTAGLSERLRKNTTTG